MRDIRIRLCHMIECLKKQAIGIFHDVCLMHAGNQMSAMRSCIFKRKAGNALARLARDQLDAMCRIRTDLILKTHVQVFRILPDHDQIHVLISAFHADSGMNRAEICIGAKPLAQLDIDGTKSLADRRCRRSLEGNAILFDRFDQPRLDQTSALFKIFCTRMEFFPFDASIQHFRYLLCTF